MQVFIYQSCGNVCENCAQLWICFAKIVQSCGSLQCAIFRNVNKSFQCAILQHLRFFSAPQRVEFHVLRLWVVFTFRLRLIQLSLVFIVPSQLIATLHVNRFAFCLTKLRCDFALCLHILSSCESCEDRISHCFSCAVSWVDVVRNHDRIAIFQLRSSL